MPLWKKAEKPEQNERSAFAAGEDRVALDRWLTQCGIHSFIDLTDLDTFPGSPEAEAALSRAVAAALADDGGMPQALPRLLLRLACKGQCHAELLTHALPRLSTRQLRTAIHGILPIGNSFPELLAFLQDPPSGISDATLRRLAYAFTTVRPGEFWPRFHHARRTTRADLKGALITALINRFPAFTSEACILLSGFDREACTSAKVQALIDELAQTRIGEIRDWGLLNLLQACLRGSAPDKAVSIYRNLDPSRIAPFLRAHILQEVNKALQEKESPLAREERLRVLATIAVCDPLYGHSAEAVRTLYTLLARETPSQSTNVQTAFTNGEKAFFGDGIDVDLNHTAIRALVMPDWLGTEAYDRFCAHPPLPLRPVAELAEAATLFIPGAKYWSQFNDDDPVKYVTSLDQVRLPRHPQCLYEAEDVIVYPDSGLCLYTDSDGAVYRHISYGRANFFSGRTWQNVSDEYKGKTALTLTLGYGDDNYCHFLFDRAPLLELTCLQGDWKPDIILIEDKLVNWCRQLLNQIGCTIPVHGLRHGQAYALSRVRAFNATQHPGQFWPETYLDFYRRFRYDDTAPSRRVFIVRPQGRRGIANEDEIHDLAVARGFELVRLETLSLAEQIRLFSETRFVAGVHGAGFSNIVFSRPGTRVLELVKKGYITGSYSISAGRMQMPYAILLDESGGSDEIRGETKFEDLRIDPQKFIQIVDLLDSDG